MAVFHFSLRLTRVSGHLAPPHHPTLSPDAGGASAGFKGMQVPPPSLRAPTVQPGHPSAYTRLLRSKSCRPRGLTRAPADLQSPWEGVLQQEERGRRGCRELAGASRLVWGHARNVPGSDAPSPSRAAWGHPGRMQLGHTQQAPSHRPDGCGCYNQT